jgi:hypothetical protein
MVLGVPDIDSQRPSKPVGVIACVSLTDNAELNRTLVHAHAVGIFALEVNGLVDDYVVLLRQSGLLSLGTGRIVGAEPSGRRGPLKNRFKTSSEFSKRFQQRVAPLCDAYPFSVGVRREGLGTLRCGGPVVRAGPPRHVECALASLLANLPRPGGRALFPIEQGSNQQHAVAQKDELCSGVIRMAEPGRAELLERRARLMEGNRISANALFKPPRLVAVETRRNSRSYPDGQRPVGCSQTVPLLGACRTSHSLLSPQASSGIAGRDVRPTTWSTGDSVRSSPRRYQAWQ